MIAAATIIVGTIVGVAQSNLNGILRLLSRHFAQALLCWSASSQANQMGEARNPVLPGRLCDYQPRGVRRHCAAGRARFSNDELNDYAGLWHTHTREHAGLINVSTALALGGLPPTAGFIGKWYIFSAAIECGVLQAWAIASAC